MEVKYGHVTEKATLTWYRSQGTMHVHILWQETHHGESSELIDLNVGIDVLHRLISTFGPVRDLTLNGVIYAVEGEYISTAPAATQTRWDLVKNYPLILSFANIEDAMLAKFILTE